MKKLTSIVTLLYCLNAFSDTPSENYKQLSKSDPINITQQRALTTPYPLYEYIYLRPDLAGLLAKEFGNSIYEVTMITESNYVIKSSEMEANVHILNIEDNKHDSSIRYYIEGHVNPLYIKIAFEMNLDISATNNHPGVSYNVNIETLPKRRWLSWLVRILDGHVGRNLEMITNSVDDTAMMIETKPLEVIEKLDQLFKTNQIKTNDYYFLRGIMTY
ncbi:MAG: hypothetical protein ACMXYG_02950 [Candidatus Woesearchaeota archaeon]